MGQKMTWDEMKKTYPDEWVAVVNYTSDEVGNVEGEVVFHSNDKSEFYRHAKDVVSQYGGMAMRYTGELIKNAEVPLLWQISNMT
jgi:hypothetical protein